MILVITASSTLIEVQQADLKAAALLALGAIAIFLPLIRSIVQDLINQNADDN